MKMHTNTSSIDATIEKVDEFMGKILHIMQKKTTIAENQRKIALLRISQMFLQKSLALNHTELHKLTRSVSGLLTCPDTDNDMKHQVSISPSCEFTSSSSATSESLASIIENEFDDLAVLLFEEANKFVAEERKKHAAMQERLEALSKQLEMRTPDSCQNIAISFNDLPVERHRLLKSVDELEMNEKIFIDGYFLTDFQECLAKYSGCKNDELETVLMSPFCRRIYHMLIEPSISQFRACTKSASTRKKLLECMQNDEIVILHASLNSASNAMCLERTQVTKCYVCGYERTCEFSLSASPMDIQQQPIDRFCKEKLESIVAFYRFIRETMVARTQQPLLTLYRTLIKHLHQLSNCIVQGAVLSTSIEDLHYPNIEILN